MLVHKDRGEVVNVTKSERISCITSSRGNQTKWFHDGRFIKLNNGDCYEDISEVLVSYFLEFTSVDNFVEYFPCEIVEDGVFVGYGCYSYNFLRGTEQDITFARLLKRNGLDIAHAGYDDIRDSLWDISGVDYKPYIDTCLCIDAITFNEDRHFNNFSVVFDGSRYSFAPIYDNGLSCLSDVYSYPLSVSIDSNLKKVFAKPFKFSFEEQLKDAHVTPILVRDKEFLESVNLQTEIELRALNVIKIGLERFRGLAWERY